MHLGLGPTGVSERSPGAYGPSCFAVLFRRPVGPTTLVRVSSHEPQRTKRGSRIAAVGGIIVVAGGLGWFALSHVVMGTPIGDAAGEALGVMLGLLVVTSVLGAILGNRSG